MGKNSIQLQGGLSLSLFIDTYGTEEQCEAVLIKSMWPDGYRCPICTAHIHMFTGRQGNNLSAQRLPKAGFTDRGNDLSLYETLVG